MCSIHRFFINGHYLFAIFPPFLKHPEILLLGLKKPSVFSLIPSLTHKMPTSIFQANNFFHRLSHQMFLFQFEKLSVLVLK